MEFDKLAAGREAALVKSLVAPYIQKGKDQATYALLSKFRSGSLTMQETWGLLGKLAALEDLETHVVKKIAEGQLSA